MIFKILSGVKKLKNLVILVQSKFFNVSRNGFLKSFLVSKS